MSPAPPPPALEPFRQLVAELDYPMFVVTTAAGDERAGCLVGFASQCSIDPARMLVCISDKNHTFRVAARAEALVVHFLSEDDRELAALFGEQTGDEVDKLGRCRWHPGHGGAPVLEQCRGWVACRIVDRTDVGDHVAFVVEPVASEHRGGSGRPLGFQAVKDLTPGHEA